MVYLFCIKKVLLFISDFQKTAAVLNEFLMKLPVESEYADARDTIYLCLLQLQRLFRFLRQRYVRTDSENSDLSVRLSRLSPMTPFQDAPDKFQCRWIDLEKQNFGGSTFRNNGFSDTLERSIRLTQSMNSSIPAVLSAAKNGDNNHISVLLDQGTLLTLKICNLSVISCINFEN